MAKKSDRQDVVVKWYRSLRTRVEQLEREVRALKKAQPKKKAKRSVLQKNAPGDQQWENPAQRG